jgi:hypothetical protein
MELALEVDDGTGSQSTVALPDGGVVTVGRVKTCDVVLLGTGVSRQHCELRRLGDVVTVLNQTTTKGGTTVDGERLEPGAEVRLPAGSMIAIGEATILLRGPDDGDAPRRSKAEKAEKARSGGGEAETRTSFGIVHAQDASAAAPTGATSGTETPAAEEPAASDEAAPPAPLTPKEQAQALARRKKLERTIRNIAFVLFIFALSGVGSWLALRMAKQKKERPVRPSVAGGGVVTEEEPVEEEEEGPNPDRAWSALLRLPPDQLATGLEAFAGRFGDDPRARSATYFAEALRGGGAGPRSGTERTPAGGKKFDAAAAGAALVAAADTLREQGDLVRAAALLELAPTVAPGSPAAKGAGAALAEVRQEALDAADELMARARETSLHLGPVHALTLVLDGRSRLRGLGADEPIEELVAELEQEAARLVALKTGPRVELSGQAFTVEKDGLDAALRFDFEVAWAKLDELLTLGLDDEARLRAHWLRHHVRALDDAFKLLLTLAAGPLEGRPTCTIRAPLRARLRSADGKQALLEPIVDKGSGELSWPWTRFTPAQVQELLAALPQDDLRLQCARALHAFKTGLDDDGVTILLPWAAKKRTQGEAFSFYSLATGTPMPEGGFVVFEGRLVSPKEKERVLAERLAAKEAAAALALEAKEMKEEKKLQALVQKVLVILDAGHYEEGRAALAKIAQRHPDVPGVGDVARARLESPILRRRDVRLSKGTGRNGPSKNRLDLYLLGDGFVLNDLKQLQFDRYADSAVKFYQLQDLFKEYDAYINYWACNTVSEDEGLTKDTGDPKKTALRGRVDGGVYTIPDRGNAFELVQKAYPDQHDRQVIGIGNDYANVATGGGGVVACGKTMLSAVPHELGHALGGLGDEYDFEPNAKTGAPPSSPGHVTAGVLAPNLMSGNVRGEMLELCPWKEWLDPTGLKNWSQKPVDLFEGGNRQPKDVWRPQKACVMRDIGSPFCAVCMQIMLRRIYQHVRPIDQVWPDEAEVTMTSEPLLLRVLVMKPATHDLFVHWRRKPLGATPPPPDTEEPVDEDGTRVRQPQPGTAPKDPKKDGVKDVSGKLTSDGVNFIHFIKILPKELPPGRYEFSAEVWDPTPWVLDAYRDEMRQTRTWVVTVPPR